MLAWMPEFVGRFGDVVAVDVLNDADGDDENENDYRAYDGSITAAVDDVLIDRYRLVIFSKNHSLPMSYIVYLKLRIYHYWVLWNRLLLE